jgi:hypothetical protein
LFLIFAVSLNRATARVSTWLCIVFGLSAFAFLVYIKYVYPFISYYLLGRDTDWAISWEKYFGALLLQGEFSANFVLFYKYIDLLKEHAIEAGDLQSYFFSFFPLQSQLTQTAFGSVGAQVRQYLNVWSGLASGPYLYPYSVGGFVGLTAIYVVIFTFNEMMRSLFYRWRGPFGHLCLAVFLPSLAFFHFRNEAFFIFKRAYIVLGNIGLVFALAAFWDASAPPILRWRTHLAN